MRFAFILLLLACNRGDPEPTEWSGPKRSQMNRYLVEVELEPDPPPMGELFVLQATVHDRDGTPMEDAKVTLDAQMPQHFHGMETQPILRDPECDDEENCIYPGGVYVADGFKFHMGGEWTISVEVEGPRGRDRATFVYDMEG